MVKSSPSFFKLLTPPTLYSNQLRLPENFAVEFRDELSDVCQLTVPTGETHHVVLVEEDDHLWFRDGWEQFMDRFSIGYGYFFTFTYCGESKFNVSVFDLSTACEISYDQCPAKAVESLDSDDDETNEEELNETDAADDTERDEESKDSQQMEMDGDDDEMNSQEGTGSNSDTMEKGVGGSLFGVRLPVPVWLKPFMLKLKEVIAAGIHIPANPFFVVVIKPYHLVGSGFVIPSSFAHKYINCRAGNSILVYTSDGSRWVVRCCRNGAGCSLGKGWTKLRQYVDLEVNDVCLLELTNAENVTLKLYVAKAS